MKDISSALSYFLSKVDVNFYYSIPQSPSIGTHFPFTNQKLWILVVVGPNQNPVINCIHNPTCRFV